MCYMQFLRAAPSGQRTSEADGRGHDALDGGRPWRRLGAVRGPWPLDTQQQAASRHVRAQESVRRRHVGTEAELELRAIGGIGDLGACETGQGL